MRRDIRAEILPATLPMEYRDGLSVRPGAEDWPRKQHFGKLQLCALPAAQNADRQFHRIFRKAQPQKRVAGRLRNVMPPSRSNCSVRKTCRSISAFRSAGFPLSSVVTTSSSCSISRSPKNTEHLFISTLLRIGTDMLFHIAD